MDLIPVFAGIVGFSVGMCVWVGGRHWFRSIWAEIKGRWREPLRGNSSHVSAAAFLLFFPCMLVVLWTLLYFALLSDMEGAKPFFMGVMFGFISLLALVMMVWEGRMPRSKLPKWL
jgi:hypothetical protein